MPTETTASRLIDANALDIALRDAYYACDESKDHHDKFLMSWLNSARRILESAPTVETTDDVMARLPHGSDTEKWMLHAKWKTEVFYKGVYDLTEIGWTRIETRWNTLLEAVTRLEAELRA